MYNYKAKVLRVIDGDTIDILIDLGWKIQIKDRIRFLGVDTPETRTRDKEEKKRGLEAKKYVIDKIEGKEIEIHTEKAGKFGRYLATVYYLEGKKKINLNKELVKKGLGKEYFGGKR